MADFTSPSSYVRTQQLLTCLHESFNANDRCPSDYGIPLPDAAATNSVERQVRRWLRDPELEAFVNDRPLLGEQLEVSSAVDEYFASKVERSTFGILFIDGPPGTGKTTTVKHVLSRGRLDGKLSLVCAPTNLAALLYETGVSAHSLFELTVQRFPDEPVQSRISSPMASKAQLIKHAKTSKPSACCPTPPPRFGPNWKYATAKGKLPFGPAADISIFACCWETERERRT